VGIAGDGGQARTSEPVARKRQRVAKNTVVTAHSEDASIVHDDVAEVGFGMASPKVDESTATLPAAVSSTQPLTDDSPSGRRRGSKAKKSVEVRQITSPEAVTGSGRKVELVIDKPPVAAERKKTTPKVMKASTFVQSSPVKTSPSSPMDTSGSGDPERRRSSGMRAAAVQSRDAMLARQMQYGGLGGSWLSAHSPIRTSKLANCYRRIRTCTVARHALEMVTFGETMPPTSPSAIKKIHVNKKHPSLPPKVVDVRPPSPVAEPVKTSTKRLSVTFKPIESNVLRADVTDDDCDDEIAKISTATTSPTAKARTKAVRSVREGVYVTSVDFCN
jgi:hypothetical protein